MSIISQKSIWLDLREFILLESNILSSKLAELVIHRRSRNFQMVVNFTRYIFLVFKKIFTTSIFLSNSKRLLLNIPETRSSAIKFSSTLTDLRIVNLFEIKFNISYYFHVLVHVFRKPFSSSDILRPLTFWNNSRWMCF